MQTENIYKALTDLLKEDGKEAISVDAYRRFLHRSAPGADSQPSLAIHLYQSHFNGMAYIEEED